ncbi:MAG: YhgE/Pip domain-containing protein [Oscillospiraceae bacterium]|nr:YhgE/Pip domain-containing protein [Candidatus Ruminococcus equi]
MKTIFSIFKRDVKKIFTNPMAIILAVGVAILPSLYAWINIAANWDPYGPDSTGNMQVAVIIEDKGNTYKGIDINVGQKIEDSLKGNNVIDWQFVDKETGLSGVEASKYYAAIYVPENFSESLTSIVTDKFTQPKITYYANEKKNAIATKITDKVVQTVQTTVNQQYVETVVKLLGNVIGVATEATKDSSKESMVGLDDELEQARDFLKTVKDSINSFTDVVEISEELSDSFSSDELKKLLDDSNKTIDDTKEAVKFTKATVDTIVSSIDVVLEDVQETMQSVIDDIDDMIDKPQEELVEELDAINLVLSQMSSRLTIISETLTDINDNLPVKLDAITKLVEKIDKVNDSIKGIISVIDDIKTEAVTKENLKLIKAKLNNMLTLVNDIVTTYKSEVKDAIETGVNDAMDILADLSNLITAIDSDLPNVSKFVSAVSDMLDESGNLIGGLNRILDDCDKQLADFQKEIKGLSDSEVFNTISNLTGKSDSVGTFLACPVQIETDKVYSVPNYGSAMAPFYTTLAIWVGAIILVALLKTDVKKKKELGGNVKYYHEYFGRGIIFILFAILQATIICLGDIFFLHVELQHPLMFLLAGIWASIVYSLFIYSIVSAFGDIGKAVAVIMLVIQLGASGGTFPIDVTPEFFQAVHPYAPFTFIINAMRECLCGTYGSDYWLDLLKLGAYIIVALFIGLVLKWLFKNPIKFFTKKIEETDIF